MYLLVGAREKRSVVVMFTVLTFVINNVLNYIFVAVLG